MPKEKQALTEFKKLVETRDVVGLRGFMENNSDEIDINQTIWPDTTPLLYACQERHVELAKYFLYDLNAEVSKLVNGFSPLLMVCAVRLNNNDHLAEESVLEIVKCLLDRKANVNVHNPKGQSPLMYVFYK